MNEAFMLRVIRESYEYAERYSCTFGEALYDWEGDGPSGSWGLTSNERDAVMAWHLNEG